MLFDLGPDQVKRVARGDFRAEFTGAEMLICAFPTERGVVERVLPKPLRPLPVPVALAFVARYPRTNFNDGYTEGALFVGCRHRARPGMYCLSMPVDDDTAMVLGREHLGFPKKMGSISLARSGDEIVGSVVRKGVEILRLEASLGGAADVAALGKLGGIQRDDAGRPALPLTSYNFKMSPRCTGKGFDFIPQLVSQVTLMRPRPGLRAAAGTLKLASTPYDPLGEIPIAGEPFAFAYGVFDNTMLPGRVAARMWNVWRFLPRALWKTDAIPHLLGEAPA